MGTSYVVRSEKTDITLNQISKTLSEAGFETKIDDDCLKVYKSGETVSVMKEECITLNGRYNLNEASKCFNMVLEVVIAIVSEFNLKMYGSDEYHELDYEHLDNAEYVKYLMGDITVLNNSEVKKLKDQKIPAKKTILLDNGFMIVLASLDGDTKFETRKRIQTFLEQKGITVREKQEFSFEGFEGIVELKKISTEWLLTHLKNIPKNDILLKVDSDSKQIDVYAEHKDIKIYFGSVYRDDFIKNLSFSVNQKNYEINGIIHVLDSIFEKNYRLKLIDKNLKYHNLSEYTYTPGMLISKEEYNSFSKKIEKIYSIKEYFDDRVLLKTDEKCFTKLTSADFEKEVENAKKDNKINFEKINNKLFEKTFNSLKKKKITIYNEKSLENEPFDSWAVLLFADKLEKNIVSIREKCVSNQLIRGDIIYEEDGELVICKVTLKEIKLRSFYPYIQRVNTTLNDKLVRRVELYVGMQKVDKDIEKKAKVIRSDYLEKIRNMKKVRNP